MKGGAQRFPAVGREPRISRPTGPVWPAWHCPGHGLELSGAPGGLVCPLGHSFAVVGGIPRFTESERYASSFGFQWNRFRRTQLDSYTGTTISTDRARRVIGRELWEDLRDRHILEAGCGAGRFTEVLLKQGARVTSVDLSNAVEANASNFRLDGNHRVAQADIMRPPFAPAAFDVVFCLGVIQHTGNPEATIAALAARVRAGGALVIDHYTPELAYWTKLGALLRFYFRRLPPRTAMRRVERLVEALLPLHRAVGRFYPAQVILSRLSPVRVYFRGFPQLSDDLHREWALLDTYDSLTAWHRHVRTGRRIQRTLEELGLVDISISRTRQGVEARARVPDTHGARTRAARRTP